MPPTVLWLRFGCERLVQASRLGRNPKSYWTLCWKINEQLGDLKKDRPVEHDEQRALIGAVIPKNAESADCTFREPTGRRFRAR